MPTKESKNVDPRVVLIEEIQKSGRSYQAAAEVAAMNSVRQPQNKEAATIAREAIVRHDTRMAMADEVIMLVRKHWPKDA